VALEVGVQWCGRISKQNFRQIWAKFRPICVKFDSVWAKIKILHPQKHSISYAMFIHLLVFWKCPS